MSKMRVGLIIDDGPQSKLIWDFLQYNKNANFYSIDLLIVQKTFRTNKSGILKKVRNYINRRGLKKLFGAASFSLLESIEAIIVKKNPKFKDFYKMYTEMGGDGFYSACVVPYLEPVFQDNTKSRSPWHCVYTIVCTRVHI